MSPSNQPRPNYAPHAQGWSYQPDIDGTVSFPKVTYTIFLQTWGWLTLVVVGGGGGDDDDDDNDESDDNNDADADAFVAVIMMIITI